MAEETKVCTKCPEDDNIKPLSEFHLIKGGTAYRPECKKCNNAMYRAYKARNRGSIAAYNKEYKAEHVDEISVYNHDYNKENREAIQKRQTRTVQIRKETDENFNMAGKLRGKLNYFVKNKGGCSPEFMKDLIGCYRSAFKFWYECMFDENMTWENYGEYWSNDHVNPCCNFDLTDEENQSICFHWSNLRPIVKMNNWKKTGKIDQDEIDEQKDTAEHFYKLLPKELKSHYTII